MPRLTKFTSTQGNIVYDLPLTSHPVKQLNIMLIGCGPYAKHIYLPALAEQNDSYRLNLTVVVELESQKAFVEEAVKGLGPVKLVLTKKFKNPYSLPTRLVAELNKAVAENNIDGVIISTEPLSHMQYTLWAAKSNLHVLINKPLSTHEFVASRPSHAKRLYEDYQKIVAVRNPKKAFLINAQRRYDPGFIYALDLVGSVAEKYHIPITSVQGMYCDGQWRLPKEMLTQQYHTYMGYGKVSHSGYHQIDLMSRLIEVSFGKSGKNFDEIGAFSSFIRPTGLLYQQNREDYIRLFG
ncbi:MAG TPA: Gfo/Idh/MocA family oxidoreductase, partial [Candidatus Limnocylindrales bacterium]|nr:Gfo/Idh/MocA family oxidoreductase [Candidatus Limnocylindrales bacterium]